MHCEEKNCKNYMGIDKKYKMGTDRFNYCLKKNNLSDMLDMSNIIGCNQLQPADQPTEKEELFKKLISLIEQLIFANKKTDDFPETVNIDENDVIIELDKE